MRAARSGRHIDIGKQHIVLVPKKRVMIVGGDGYLGWATSLYLSQQGHDVAILDNLVRRYWDLQHFIQSLTPLASITDHVDVWQRVSGRRIEVFLVDVREYEPLVAAMKSFRPDTIVHFGEQCSAPFSMIDRQHAILTQVGNLTGTLNILFAMLNVVPNAHLVKLGTMGEYGTPNIDIEEGYLEIDHNGRRDTLPFPKQPGSFYHLSKVHDSDNIAFACRIWNLRATDLNQGVVYGISRQTTGHQSLANRFNYDELFGTVLNRFCVQAAVDHPLTVYGKGGQTRGFININDTVACVEIALSNPPKPGRLEIFNQFTQRFSVLALAQRVQTVARGRGLNCTIDHGINPRVEREEHYYNPKNTKLIDLGLQPHFLEDAELDAMLELAECHRDRINARTIEPGVSWAPRALESSPPTFLS